MTTTPCQEEPEAWVGDNDKLRAEAAKECATCPVLTECQRTMFGADKFGVVAGVDYGTKGNPTARSYTPRPEEFKECVVCHDTIRRGKRGRADWEKMRYCSKKCYGSTMAATGLPERKTCQECGVSFARAGRSPAHWLRAQFCGVACSGKASSRRRRAVA